MIVIVEGLDRCGKDTLIKNLKQKIFNSPKTITIHCSTPPKNSDSTWSLDHYSFILSEAVKLTTSGWTVFLNRSHFGEDVYGPLYRHNNADWVHDLTKTHLKNVDSVAIFLVDEPDALIEREDGESLYTKSDDIKRTKERFEYVYDKCTIPKFLYNITLDGGWINLDTKVINFIKENMDANN